MDKRIWSKDSSGVFSCKLFFQDLIGSSSPVDRKIDKNLLDKIVCASLVDCAYSTDLSSRSSFSPENSIKSFRYFLPLS